MTDGVRDKVGLNGCIYLFSNGFESQKIITCGNQKNNFAARENLQGALLTSSGYWMVALKWSTSTVLNINPSVHK
jgi:hypothetical protein